MPLTPCSYNLAHKRKGCVGWASEDIFSQHSPGSRQQVKEPFDELREAGGRSGVFPEKQQPPVKPTDQEQVFSLESANQANIAKAASKEAKEKATVLQLKTIGQEKKAKGDVG